MSEPACNNGETKWMYRSLQPCAAGRQALTAARLCEEENRRAAELEEDEEVLYNNELVVEAGASDEERRDEEEDTEEEDDLRYVRFYASITGIFC